MNIPILNRDDKGNWQLPPDGLFDIVRVGEFKHGPSGLVQVVDDAALDAIINRFNQDLRDKTFPGLLVDYDHFSYNADKSSEAAGWIQSLSKSNGTLKASIKWAPAGEAAIKNGAYRMVSPVWLPDDVEKLGGNRIRPLRLDSIGLTNNPNIRGLLPLANRDQTINRGSQGTNNMKQIASALGLAPEASEEAVLTALTALKNRATKAETDFEAAKTTVAKLEGENMEMMKAVVDGDLEKYANRFKPESKEAWRKQLIANRAGTIELLESLSVEVPPGDATKANAPLANRNASIPPAAGSDEDKAKNRLIRAKEIQSKQGCSWDHAWNQTA